MPENSNLMRMSSFWQRFAKLPTSPVSRSSTTTWLTAVFLKTRKIRKTSTSTADSPSRCRKWTRNFSHPSWVSWLLKNFIFSLIFPCFTRVLPRPISGFRWTSWLQVIIERFLWTCGSRCLCCLRTKPLCSPGWVVLFASPESFPL